MTETENQTLHLLQAMRADMKSLRADMNQRMSVVDAHLSDIETQINGVTNILVMMNGQNYSLEQRVTALEKAGADE